MANELDFNIYDDLDNALMEPLEKDVEKSRAEIVAKEAAEKELQRLLEKKDEEIKGLNELNQRLQTNLSMLLLTTKSELSRRVFILHYFKMVLEMRWISGILLCYHRSCDGIVDIKIDMLEVLT